MQSFIVAKRDEIAELCRRHHVRRLSVFGSAARDDFDPVTSDVDLLVEFDSHAIDRYARNFFSFEDSMAGLFDKRVDLVMEGSVRNPYLLRHIEQDRKQLYAA